MTFTSLGANDTGSTSRGVINTNFTTAQTELDTKVEYSSTTPAIGDLVVAAATDGLSIKKKVFTASQVLESDSNGQPTSAAKGTGYNLNLGTSAGTVLEGSNDALYTKLAGTQTVTGDKTFSGTSRAVTQSQSDNSTKIATTAYVDTGLAAIPGPNTVPNTIVTATSYMTYQLMPTCGPTADAISNGWVESAAIVAAPQGGGGYLLFDTAANADALIYTVLPGVGTGENFLFSNIGASAISIKTRLKFEAVDAGESMCFGLAITAGLYAVQTDTGSNIRFVVADSTGDKLFACNANGVTATTTDISSGLTLTSWNTYEMVITSTSVLFYVNGTLKATHTTNLPTAATAMNLGWGIIDNGSSPKISVTPILISLPTA